MQWWHATSRLEARIKFNPPATRSFHRTSKYPTPSWDLAAAAAAAFRFSIKSPVSPWIAFNLRLYWFEWTSRWWFPWHLLFGWQQFNKVEKKMNAISSRYLNQSIFNAKYHDGAPGGRDQSLIDVRLKLTSTQPAVRMVTTTTRVLQITIMVRMIMILPKDCWIRRKR